MANVNKNAILVLEDGLSFLCSSFGYSGKSFGEIVFNTGMTGYQETLTDPSYFGQIVIQTFPHIGNTGTNFVDNESKKVWVNGYIISDLSQINSSWRAKNNLKKFLRDQKICAVSNLDTRLLTKHIRDKGAMRAGVFANLDKNIIKKFEEYAYGERIIPPTQFVHEVKNSPIMNGAYYSKNVTTDKKYIVKPKISKYKVVALDLGIKSMTPELLSKRGIETIIMPSTTSFDDIMKQKPDGIFLSNGPGDPAAAKHEIGIARCALKKKIPFFGICMGNQILGLALGFPTYKLKFGHRGINQPVIDLNTEKVEITAHNHGFAIDIPVGKTIIAPFDKDFGRVKVSHICLNDNVVEGIECLDIPAFSVQYHPEAAAGPHDASYLFDRFVNMIKEKHA